MWLGAVPEVIVTLTKGLRTLPQDAIDSSAQAVDAPSLTVGSKLEFRCSVSTYWQAYLFEKEFIGY
jgi:hypothetical protein